MKPIQPSKEMAALQSQLDNLNRIINDKPDNAIFRTAIVRVKKEIADLEAKEKQKRQEQSETDKKKAANDNTKPAPEGTKRERQERQAREGVVNAQAALEKCTRNYTNAQNRVAKATSPRDTEEAQQLVAKRRNEVQAAETNLKQAEEKVAKKSKAVQSAHEKAEARVASDNLARSNANPCQEREEEVQATRPPTRSPSPVPPQPFDVIRAQRPYERETRSQMIQRAQQWVVQTTEAEFDRADEAEAIERQIENDSAIAWQMQGDSVCGEDHGSSEYASMVCSDAGTGTPGPPLDEWEVAMANHQFLVRSGHFARQPTDPMDDFDTEEANVLDTDVILGEGPSSRKRKRADDDEEAEDSDAALTLSWSESAAGSVLGRNEDHDMLAESGDLDMADMADETGASAEDYAMPLYVSPLLLSTSNCPCMF